MCIRDRLDGLFQLERSQGSALAEDAGIAFFATKATTHAAANHFDVVGVQVQGVRGFALVAVGVLGRHVQRKLAVFLGHRVSDLAFQIELLLLTSTGLPLILCGALAMAAAASPRVMPLGGMMKLPASIASSTVKMGLSSLTSTLAFLAASRT